MTKEETLRYLKEKKVKIATVSGVSSTRPGMISFFDEEVGSVDIITTKSLQVRTNPGNREPILCEMGVGDFGNSVGLPAPGLATSLTEIRSARPHRALFNISLAADNPEDFITLLKTFTPYADLFELNFSCPHAAPGFGASIGCSGTLASDYVRKIRKNLPGLPVPLFVKLTPNVPDIGAIAKAVIEAGADGITAINTVGPEVHLSPLSGTPILQNKIGGKGGKSGRWIHEKALACVRAIRKAVGPRVPVIGMGGVDDGAKAAAMIEAGADVVGIGSALGTVSQMNWEPYLSAIKREAEDILGGEHPDLLSAGYPATKNRMEYKKFTVRKKEMYGEDIAVLTLDGPLDSKAGEFIFVWIPGVGEKPFSAAGTDPLSLVVKKRGVLTGKLVSLPVGSTVYVRGVYGRPVESFHAEKSLIIAGGTGVAVLPMLAKQLQGEGSEVTMLVGTSASVPGPGLLEDDLKQYGKFVQVADDGQPGRVLGLIDGLPVDGETGIYLVGPEVFMASACKKLLARGAASDHIALSMERLTRCGVGICGECVCGHRLACQWGTFMPYDYLREEAPALLRL